MPGGDGTGPAGMGPMTGRAAGFCAGYPVPGYMNPVGGRGYFGMGRGGGRGGGWGRRNMFYATGLPGWQRFGSGYPAYGGGAAPRQRRSRSWICSRARLSTLRMPWTGSKSVSLNLRLNLKNR